MRFGAVSIVFGWLLACCGLLACGSLLTACGIGGSSPDPDFYLLYPHEGQTAAAPPLHIELRRPALPEHLQRPEMVRAVEGGKLTLSETDRWAGSLATLVSSTLVRDLAQRLPNSAVYAEGGAISARPDLRIELDVDDFGRSAGGDVVLRGRVALHWQGEANAPAVQRFDFRGASTPETTQALVATMSELLGQLATQLARHITQHVSASPPPPSPTG